MSVLRGQRTVQVVPPFPDAHAAWFLELSVEKRREILSQWHARVRAEADCARQAGLSARRALVQMMALFAVADLVCPGRSLASFALAALAGAVIGAGAHKLEWERFATATAGVLAFVLLEWWTRGGLSALHLFVLFPFASVCALFGYAREERGVD